MRVLIDTNIFIELEGSNILDRGYSSLLRVLEKAHAQILIHPASLDDLRRDRDSDRRARNLSRVHKYTELLRPPDCAADFAAAGINCLTPNDKADCEILCAVYKDAVNFLVTEDNGIHRKAKALGIGARVFFVAQALSSFSATFSDEPIKLPNIQQVFVYEIKDYLADTFFDSIRTNYPGFDTWFVGTCCREGREAWIARDATGALAAICIFKNQEPEPLTDEGRALPGPALKLCPLKVGPSIQGQKIGELFLKAAFKYARQTGAENILLTVKNGQQPHLESLLSDFGFEIFGTLKDELVMVKRHPVMPPLHQNLDPLQYNKAFWPHMIADTTVRKFIVPIQPQFHRQLFPDWVQDTQQLRLQFPASSGALTTQNLGNALKLAYLCHSKISKISAGDILFFYRSNDFQELTTIGIVETVVRLSNAEEILKRVLKRTVYSATEIDEMADKETLVLLFRLGLHLPNAVTRKFLVANGVKGNIQTIREIEHSLFQNIAHEGAIEDCLLTN